MEFRVRSPFSALALGLLAASSAQAQGFLDQLKQAVGGDYTVRGRVQVHGGQWLTCFNGNNTGYLGPANLARPGDARMDPATGKMRVTTAAIPTVIMTRNGTVTSNDCDALDKQGLLMLPTQAGEAAKADGGYSDGQGCTDPSWTKDEIVRRRREIMDCQARAITDREFARQEAQRKAQAKNGTAAAGAGDGERQAANAKLQQDTAAKFKAIQAQAGAPAAAPAAQSAEDLAWDGAKLCSLKPAYMMKLSEDAVRFVRFDKAGSRIVLSEMVGGARQDVTIDGNAFAQRISFNAAAIGQGGDTCGRAFWNAEAYKAASAAMSGS